MMQSIENDFETLKQKSKYACWVALKHTCVQQGVTAPSYRAFRRALGKRSQFEQTLKRKGRRAAYKYEPAYWDLDLTTPRHGDRPFEIGGMEIVAKRPTRQVLPAHARRKETIGGCCVEVASFR